MTLYRYVLLIVNKFLNKHETTFKLSCSYLVWFIRTWSFKFFQSENEVKLNKEKSFFSNINSTLFKPLNECRLWTHLKLPVFQKQICRVPTVFLCKFFLAKIELKIDNPICKTLSLRMTFLKILKLQEIPTEIVKLNDNRCSKDRSNLCVKSIVIRFSKYSKGLLSFERRFRTAMHVVVAVLTSVYCM